MGHGEGRIRQHAFRRFHAEDGHARHRRRNLRHGHVAGVGAVAAYELTMCQAVGDAIVEKARGHLEASDADLPCRLFEEAERVREARLAQGGKARHVGVYELTKVWLVERARLLLLGYEEHMELDPRVDRGRERRLLATASRLEASRISY